MTSTAAPSTGKRAQRVNKTLIVQLVSSGPQFAIGRIVGPESAPEAKQLMLVYIAPARHTELIRGVLGMQPDEVGPSAPPESMPYVGTQLVRIAGYVRYADARPGEHPSVTAWMLEPSPTSGGWKPSGPLPPLPPRPPRPTRSEEPAAPKGPPATVYKGLVLNVVTMEAYVPQPEKTTQPEKLRSAFKELCSRRPDSSQLMLVWLRQQPDGGWEATDEPAVRTKLAPGDTSSPAQELCPRCAQPFPPASVEKK